MVDKEITPRERVKLALLHEETDRVPVDFLATDETWKQLQENLGVSGRDEVMAHLGVDLRHPRMRYMGPPLRQFQSGGYGDPWGMRWEPVAYPRGTYFEVVERPLADITDASELEGYPWPDPGWWDVESIVDQIAQWDQQTEYAIVLDEFGDPGGIFEIAWYMRGLEQFMVDMVSRPEIPFEIMRHVTDFFCALAERALTRLGDRVDLIWTSDDIAHQRGLMLSPSLWKDLIQPHHERLNRLVHAMGGRIMYHCCGSVMDMIPNLIEMGIDVLDVLQFSAANMDPEVLKRRFGDRLSFHGGVDVQQLLPFATPGQVAQHTRHLIEVLGAGGGFILSPTHNIQIDVPPENILAVYRAAGSLQACVPR